MVEKQKPKEPLAQSLFPLSEHALRVGRDLRKASLKGDYEKIIAHYTPLSFSHPKLAETYFEPLARALAFPELSGMNGDTIMRIMDSGTIAYAMILHDAKEKRIKLRPITITDLGDNVKEGMGEMENKEEEIVRIANTVRNLESTGMTTMQATRTLVEDTGVGMSTYVMSDQFYRKLLEELQTTDPNVYTYLSENYGDSKTKEITLDPKKGGGELRIFLDVYDLFAVKTGYRKREVSKS